MEENYSSCCLSSLKYQALIWKIINAVREKAMTFSELRESKNGCIRITMVPLSELAELWLGGGLSMFRLPGKESISDICEREFVYKLHPEGSHTMQYVADDGHVEPVNCYGYSALKVAYSSWKRKFDVEMKQANATPDEVSQEHDRRTQYFVAENGYSMDGGVICTTVRFDDADFLRIYVTVSGARSGDDDLQCSLDGVLELRDFFTDPVCNDVPLRNSRARFKLYPRVMLNEAH